jgi:uncharacterized integral membrane protein
VSDVPHGGGQGRGPRFWALVVAAAVAVLFIALNSKSVDINFIVATVNTSLVVALLVATLLGVIVGYLLALFRKRDRN